VVTHELGRSDIAGVYAAGDIVNFMQNQLIWATASGSRAAIGVNTDLTASCLTDGPSPPYSEKQHGKQNPYSSRFSSRRPKCPTPAGCDASWAGLAVPSQAQRIVRVAVSHALPAVTAAQSPFPARPFISPSTFSIRCAYITLCLHTHALSLSLSLFVTVIYRFLPEKPSHADWYAGGHLLMLRAKVIIGLSSSVSDALPSTGPAIDSFSAATPTCSPSMKTPRKHCSAHGCR
jgi:hypothetical protein